MVHCTRSTVSCKSHIGIRSEWRHLSGRETGSRTRDNDACTKVVGDPHGSLSVNVAVIEYNLGVAHNDRALRARAAGDLDRCIANLEMALPRDREAARIYRAIDRLDDANDAAQAAVKIDLDLRTSRF